MLKAIGLGVLASLFFASTFVVNQLMAVHGGSWLFSSSLRYFYTVPLFLLWVLLQRELGSLFRLMRKNIWPWIIWGTVGFGLFYGPLTYAAQYGPSWAIAATFQLTIVFGSLLVPVTTHQPIPWRSLWPSVLILLGIFIVQWHGQLSMSGQQVGSFVAVMVAALAYPLGNREMMAWTQGQVHAPARIFGMTLGSLPFWIVLAAIGMKTVGPPPVWQWEQTFIVAMASGVIATALFFGATDQAHGHPVILAKIEATQSMEIVFTVVLAQIFHLSGTLRGYDELGIGLVIAGMIWHSLKAPLPIAVSTVQKSKSSSD